MIRVFVVDDSKLIYEGLRAMFASDDDLDIFGYASNGKDAIEQIKENEPDVVLVDMLMPVMDGIETTRQISKLFPEVKVIVLSSFEDDPLILKAIAAGAKGYLLKNMIAQDLSSAVRTVDRGCAHFAPGVIDTLLKNVIENKDSKSANTSKSEGNKTKVVRKKKAKPKTAKPLFRYGDLVSITLAVIILYQIKIDHLNLYLAHLGLFCLMLSLVARPICSWWSWPFKNRRLIGISAFALSLVHTAYMLNHSLNWNLDAIAFMLPQHRWGISTGILTLLLIFPAAITSSQFYQRKLGDTWRQIHLLTVPALALAISHVILIGSHYLGTFEMETINYVRTFGLIAMGSLVLLIRGALLDRDMT